jgi:hypothetical protein
MSEHNLDQLCARYGYQIAADVCGAIKKAAENHITKSLGVLQEDGVYAFALYQVSRGAGEAKGAEKLKELAKGLLHEAHLKPFEGDPGPDLLVGVRGDPQKNLKGLAEDLDSLLLAKRLLEQTLIYARYHAKSFGNREEKK